MLYCDHDNLLNNDYKPIDFLLLKFKLLNGMQKLNFSGHDSFHCRSLWLKKGV